jgi:transcriptional regulator with XRE-family HTH domain
MQLNRDVIEKRMIELELSIRDLAAFAGVETKAVNKWMAGTTFPNDRNLNGLLNKLDLSRLEAIDTDRKALTIEGLSSIFVKEYNKFTNQKSKISNRDQAMISAIVQSINRMPT